MEAVRQAAGITHKRLDTLRSGSCDFSMFALLGGTGSGYLRQAGGGQSVGVSGCFFEFYSLFAGYTGVQTARHATRSSMSQEIEYSEKYADDEFEYRCSARLSAPRPRSGA